MLQTKCSSVDLQLFVYFSQSQLPLTHAVFVVQILEGMPMTDEVEEFLRVIGPFYELIDEKKKISQISDLSTGGVLLFSRSSCTLHFVCA